MKFKKKFWRGFILGISIIFMIPRIVNATAETDELMKKFSPDLRNAVVKGIKPTKLEDISDVISGYANYIINSDKYMVDGYCPDENLKDCLIVLIYEADNEEDFVIEEYTINITFDEPKKLSNDYYQNIGSKFKTSEFDDDSTWLYLNDLSLINYYLSSDKSDLWNIGAANRALGFIPSVKNKLDNNNITLNFNVRMGEDDHDNNKMYEMASGPLSIIDMGYSISTIFQTIYLERIIYIPESTPDTDEAYVAAAQKRIDDYVGKGMVEVKKGGKIADLNNGDAECLFHEVISNGNYYTVKIGNRSYNFYIIKGTEEKLVSPNYLSKDLETNISVFSNDSSIPLDTFISVKSVNNPSIKDKINTENYVTYDIKLYSNAKEANITKLDNNLFEVSIPVPANLIGKDLIVYYETNDGELEIHKVTINKNGNAIFTTNHFSEYTLAEKNNINTDNNSNDNNNKTSVAENPPTHDELENNIFILTVSLILLIGTTIYLKKRNNIKGR